MRPIAFAILVLVATAAVAKPVSPRSVGMSAERIDALVEHFEQRVEDGKGSGYQLLIARNGKIVLDENIGYANVETKEPVSDRTLYRIFSMTKPVMAVGMMMLYEEGRFSLNDPLSKHIPEFAELKVFDGVNDDGSLRLVEPERPPTVQDLMMHTAGLTYGWFGDTPVDRLYRERQIASFEDPLPTLIDKLSDIPLLYQPGERWHYSVAVDVQGYLIEKWTGKTVEEFLSDRLFEPLGMTQTMAWAPPGDYERLATVYTHDESGVLVPSDDPMAGWHGKAPGGFSGGAQLISTADDYFRFCQMLLNSGEFDGRRYLSPPTVDMMTSNRLLPDANTTGPGRGFGLGFGVVDDPRHVPFPAGDGEYYWGGALTTVFWIDPEYDLVAIVLTQYLPWSGSVYQDLLHRLVYSAVVRE